MVHVKEYIFAASFLNEMRKVFYNVQTSYEGKMPEEKITDEIARNIAWYDAISYAIKAKIKD